MLEPSNEKAKNTGLKPSELKSKKRDKYIPNSEPLALPFCRICGKRASGIHFGVYSCEACKAFFRRYLQRKTPFKCNKGNNCVIDEQKKGLNCSACRLKKCLEKGMSKAGVRIGRYSTAERTNVIMEVKRLHASVDSSQTPSSLSPKPTGFKLTDLSCQMTVHSPEISRDSVPVICVGDTHSPSHDSIKSSSDQAENSPKSSDFPILNYFSLSPNSSGSVDSLKSLVLGCTRGETTSPCAEGSECSIGSLVSPGKGLVAEREELDQLMKQLMDGYQCLQPFSKTLTDEELDEIFKYGLEQYEDKVRLFGKMEYLSIQEYKEIYDKTKIDVDGRKELYDLCRVELNKYFDELVQFGNGIINFSSLPQNDQAALLKAADFEFSMLVDYRAADPDKGMFLSYTGKPMSMSEACPHADEETFREWAEFARYVQKLRLTPQEHALMLAISLTFQDKCPSLLESRDEVEKIQSKLITALDALTSQTNHGHGGRRFAKLMDVFVRLRGMYKSYEDAVKLMSQDEFLKECVPEIAFYL